MTYQGLDAISYDPAAKDLRHLVSAAARRAWESGQPILIKSDNWQSFADAFLGVSVAAKVRTLLEVLRSRSAFFGNTVEFTMLTDWPLLFASGPEEGQAILQHASNRNLVAKGLTATQWALTWDGWQAVEPIAGSVRGLAFVAMAFRPELEAAYEHGILAALGDCGFQAIRVDKEHFAEKICDRIIVDIRRAQFMVADFTFQRGGVYFEAGYALALGRTVIWSCRDDDLCNLHFDTRQYPHIVWREPVDLRVQLRDRLRALIPGARLS